MNVLEWRRDELRTCFDIFIPAVLENFAKSCGMTLKEWRISPISIRHATYGFHFSNVVLLEWWVDDQRLFVKLPVPNESDLFVVNDAFRILTNELPDRLVSFRLVNGNLLMRFQGSLAAIVCDEKGLVKVQNEKVPLWLLFYSSFTEEELSKLDLLFNVSSEGSLPLKSNPTLKVELPIKFDRLAPLQQLVVTSIVHTPLKGRQQLKQLQLPEHVVSYIESNLLDPITRCIYNINNLRGLLEYVIKSIEGKPKSTLVGSNLHFKRVRSYETIVIALYEKLREVSKQVRYQKKLRISSDFLLKKMFTHPTLQRLFEYYDRSNLFKELSLRYKVVVPLEYVPYDLRDVHFTAINNICIYDTPDDEGIGVKLQLAIDCELERFGFFK